MELENSVTPNQWMGVNMHGTIRGVPRGSAFGLFLFNIFINSLDEDVKIVLVKSAVDTVVGGIAYVLGSTIRFYLSQLCDLASKNANINLGCCRRSAMSTSREVITLLLSTLN